MRMEENGVETEHPWKQVEADQQWKRVEEKRSGRNPVRWDNESENRGKKCDLVGEKTSIFLMSFPNNFITKEMYEDFRQCSQVLGR